MIKISISFKYFLLLLIIAPNSIFAAHNDDQANSEGLRESEQCISLIRECFSYHGYNRSNCFFTSATHPFCEGSELASLAYRRWVLSPSDGPKVTAENTGQAHASAMQAFLGPQLVDPACIEESDKRLEASIRINIISADTVRKLSASLEACRRDIGLELQRQ